MHAHVTYLRNPSAPHPEYDAGWWLDRPRFTTEAQIREEVRQQAAAGVDFVKVYAGLAPPLVRAVIR